MVLVALVLLTLAPGISRAMAFAQGEATLWDIVCSASKMAAFDGGSASRAADGGPKSTVAHWLDHCPYCGLGAGGFGPPPSAQPAFAVPASAHATPTLFLQAPRPLFAWHQAQSRGPPRLG